MAKPLMQKKSQLESPCVCLFVNSLAVSVKNMLTQLITTIVNVCKSLLVAIKLIGTLCNNYDKELKIYGYTVLLEAEKAVARPLESPFLLLTKMTKPYADCDYITTFLGFLKYVRTKVIGPTEKHIKDIENMIDTLEDQKKQWDGMDRAISALDDFNNVISSYCGTD
jgi:hypothetical protein